MATGRKPRRSGGRAPRGRARPQAEPEAPPAVVEATPISQVEDVIEQPLDSDETFFDEHHGESMDLGGELLDDVGVAATDACDDLGDELLLFGREFTHAAGSRAKAMPPSGRSDR